MRDFMDTLRASGIHPGGPAALSQADQQAFGRHLDTLLARHARQSDQGAWQEVSGPASASFRTI